MMSVYSTRAVNRTQELNCDWFNLTMLSASFNTTVAAVQLDYQTMFAVKVTSLFLLVSTLVFGTISNCGIAVTIHKYPELRTVVNRLLFFMSAIDLFITTVDTSMAIVRAANDFEPMSEAFCRALYFLIYMMGESIGILVTEIAVVSLLKLRFPAALQRLSYQQSSNICLVVALAMGLFGGIYNDLAPRYPVQVCYKSHLQLVRGRVPINTITVAVSLTITVISYTWICFIAFKQYRALHSWVSLGAKLSKRDKQRNKKRIDLATLRSTSAIILCHLVSYFPVAVISVLEFAYGYNKMLHVTYLINTTTSLFFVGMWNPLMFVVSSSILKKYLRKFVENSSEQCRMAISSGAKHKAAQDCENGISRVDIASVHNGIRKQDGDRSPSSELEKRLTVIDQESIPLTNSNCQVTEDTI